MTQIWNRFSLSRCNWFCHIFSRFQFFNSENDMAGVVCGRVNHRKLYDYCVCEHKMENTKWIWRCQMDKICRSPVQLSQILRYNQLWTESCKCEWNEKRIIKLQYCSNSYFVLHPHSLIPLEFVFVLYFPCVCIRISLFFSFIFHFQMPHRRWLTNSSVVRQNFSVDNFVHLLLLLPLDTYTALCVFF